METIKATIIWFNVGRGWGFAANPNGKWFFHANNFVEGKAALGATIEFELGDAVTADKPKQAVKIRVVQESGLGGVE